MGILAVIVFINFIVAVAVLARGVFKVIFVSEKRAEGRRELLYAAVGAPVLYVLYQILSAPA